MASSAQFMFPLAITVPAFFNLIRDKSSTYRKIGWITLVVSLIAAIYYDSRIALYTFIGIFILLPIKIRFYRFIFFFCFFIIITIGLVQLSDDYRGNFDQLSTNMFGMINTMLGQEGASRDMDRIIYIKVAFASINQGWEHLLFGHGLQTHSTVVAPYARDLFAELLPHRVKDLGDKVGTEGITAFLVDTGCIGILLLIANFICIGRTIMTNKDYKNRIILLFTLLLFFLWLFVIYLSDFVLFYVAIMPSGLLALLSRDRPSSKPMERFSERFKSES